MPHPNAIIGVWYGVPLDCGSGFNCCVLCSRQLYSKTALQINRVLCSAKFSMFSSMPNIKKPKSAIIFQRLLKHILELMKTDFLIDNSVGKDCPLSVSGLFAIKYGMTINR